MIEAFITIKMQSIVLDCGMVISSIILACWLASKKSVIIDVIAGIIAFFIVIWILFTYHVI